MFSRRTFIQMAGMGLAAPAFASERSTVTYGPMIAWHLGGSGGHHRWAYRSPLVDDPADVTGGDGLYIDVVLPDDHSRSGPHPILFLGPVAPVPGRRGNGLDLARKLDVHNEHGCILVTATFKSMPWYGARPDGTAALDRHLMESVFPMVEREYSETGGEEGRLLIGFSKSGWGAVSLILRNPGFFDYAAAWDAPWKLRFGRFGNREALGTTEQFADYDPMTIVPARAKHVSDRERLWISSGKTFIDHHRPMITQLMKHGVPHRTRFVRTAEHRWDADWLSAGCRALFDMRAA